MVATADVSNSRARLEKVRIRWIRTGHEIQSIVLINTENFLAVEDIEEVSNKLHLGLFGDGPRIICMDVKPRVTWSSTLASASAYWYLACVQVNGMWVEFVDRQPSLETHVETEVKSIKHVEASGLVEGVAAEHVNDVAPIAVEWTDCKLVTKQIQIARREVEQ